MFLNRKLRKPASRLMLVASLVFIYIGFQNCSSSNLLEFFKVNGSTIAPGMNGGNGYDGKPMPGHYCRVYDELKCQAQVIGLQSLLSVDQNGLHLLQDNCATTSTNFPFGDIAVTYTQLQPEYIGLSRGIFRKCELDENYKPILPKEMADAFCVSEDKKLSVVINKNLMSSELVLQAAYNLNSAVGTKSIGGLSKTVAANNIFYVSTSDEFTLAINASNSQTFPGRIKLVIDDVPVVTDLNCRTSGPKPTVIIENDLELSPTWIDTSQLVGYWKLNESSVNEGSTILDSSSFGTSGTLLTDFDGLFKSDLSVQGGAISLDGGGDRVSILRPADGHLDFGLGSFSFMVWIKKTGSMGYFDMPIYHGAGQNIDPGYDIECGSTICRACISDGGGQPTSYRCASFAAGGGNQLINQWVLLVAVVDRANQEIRSYLNGSLVSVRSIATVGSIDSVRNITIGGTSLPSHSFIGSVDDVAVWSRDLSASEVLEIFQRLRPKFY